jgi:transcriptional regulator with XRE-family HTH domain
MSESTVANAPAKVRAIREALNLTQKDMAEQMGISLSALRRYEYDNALPGTLAAKKALATLAKKAGVELETSQ